MPNEQNHDNMIENVCSSIEKCQKNTFKKIKTWKRLQKAQNNYKESWDLHGNSSKLQLIFEQHEFEQGKSTYMQIFSIDTYLL